MKVKIFVTGGTFDKEYNEITEQLHFRETHIYEMLRLGRNKVDVDIRVLMMIDSLEMTDQDREIILEHCENTPEKNIVITHGTSTMVETAEVLASSIRDKTIVLTGAMFPYAYGSSDGLFNLGSALAFSQALPAGVYLAMNGRNFFWHNVHKNDETGLFEELEPGTES
ncbi:MAG: asparaginase [Candidatus Kerfeldbacteria bacterium]|nr:asparaginase [Candidatus Kerfeldbacteria bacterium]